MHPTDTDTPDRAGSGEGFALPGPPRAHIRPISPADRPLLRELLGRLSEQTRLRRYGRMIAFDDARAEAEILRLLTQADRDLVLVATEGAHAAGKLVGIAELRGLRGDTGGAEIGILVRDDRQGLGIGTMLLVELCTWAGPRGVSRLHALTTGQNHRMRRLLARIGPVRSTHLGDGALDAMLQLPVRQAVA